LVGTTSSRQRDQSESLWLDAEGAASGAPHAQQVADRFLLVLNLSGAIQRALEEHSRQLLLPTPAATDEAQTTLKEEQTPPPLTQMQVRRQKQRQRRLELYEKVMQLHAEGHSQRAIGTALQIQRKTVGRCVRAGDFPERKKFKPTASKVYQFADHLRQRWTEGCHNATKLFKEIKKQGYRGQRGMVAQFVAGWRSSKPPPPASQPRCVSATQVAILATRGPDQLSAEQRSLLTQLCSTCPQLLWMRTLAFDFREPLFSKDGQQMRHWITAAKHCGIGSLVRFGFGLQKDLLAVLAAVETSYSNGQVEGQVNRLKMIKRQCMEELVSASCSPESFPTSPWSVARPSEHRELHQIRGRALKWPSSAVCFGPPSRRTGTLMRAIARRGGTRWIGEQRWRYSRRSAESTSSAWAQLRAWRTS
jgi:hypothetical protein